MKTNPLTGAPYPELTVDAPNGPSQIQGAVDALSPLTRPIFASTTARDTAYTTWTSAEHTLSEGLRSYTQAENQEWFYDGTRWTWPRGAQGVISFVEFNSATAITLNNTDTTLTIYNLPTFTVPANRRLRMTLNVTLQSDAANASFAFHMRNSGTIIRTMSMDIPLVSVPTTRAFTSEVSTSASTSYTLTISGLRAAGTGTVSLLCDSANTGSTQFFVEDIGTVS